MTDEELVFRCSYLDASNRAEAVLDEVELIEMRRWAQLVSDTVFVTAINDVLFERLRAQGLGSREAQDWLCARSETFRPTVRVGSTTT